MQQLRKVASGAKNWGNRVPFKILIQPFRKLDGHKMKGKAAIGVEWKLA